MQNKKLRIAVASVTCLFALAGLIRAADGSASVRFGYTIISDTGSLAVNQETSNTYEGFGLSVQNLRYAFNNGVTLGANLRNATLNNRDLRAVLGKPGRFSVAFTNSQYRRTYTFDGSAFTRRRQTGVQASFQPSRFFKFFGGYNLNDKHGQSATILSFTDDTIITSTDYRQTSYNLGSQIGDRYGVVRIDYRHSNFDDRLSTDADRKSDRFAVSVSSSVPNMKRLFAAGGYTYRRDTAVVWESSLRTHEFWGALRANFNDGYMAEYRVIYDMTKHVGFLRETDNLAHTVSAGKTWGRFGGLRIGYEQRIADDFINKTSSNAFVGSAWYRPSNHWSFNLRLSTRDKDVSEGATLTGQESNTGHRARVVYTDTAWGHIGVCAQRRKRTSDDLNSSIEYTSISPDLSFDTKRWGRLEGSYSYSTGIFENMSSVTSYEFLDHLITATYFFPTWRNLALDAGATYYRSKRDQDLEKSRLNFGALYTIQDQYHVEVRYNVFNYDNFLVNNSYYTGNIVEINFIKDVSF